MRIALEGLDGTGKSTIGQMAADKLGGVYYATPPALYKAARELVDTAATDIDHYRFYVGAVRAASTELATLEAPLVIIDRYWMTTIAYHRAVGIDADLADFGAIVQPDFTIFFDASTDVLAERKNRRGWTAGDRRMVDREARIREAYAELLSNTSGAWTLRTDHCSPEEAVAAIAAHIA
jgi:thymidylate kinase